MDSSRQIEERASEWLARRDSADWGEADETAFQAWLAQSTLHVVAFVRLEAAWEQAKRLKALGTGGREDEVPSPKAWQLEPFFEKDLSHDEARSLLPDVASPEWHSRLLRAAAASILLVITAVVSWYVWPAGPTYRTPVGGIASVPMSDGSKVTLNTDTKIRVDVTETERRVELQRGEAFFEVAKDPKRPFVVIVDNKRIVALGTAFSVRRDEGNVRVFVTEGRIRIDDKDESSIRMASAGDKILTLAAGSVARASDAGVLVRKETVAEVQSYLSWRTGYLIFRDMSLADAVGEFNRYNTHKIRIEDPSVKAIRISGKFRSTQFEAFVRLLEEGFPIQARTVDGQIVLSDSRKVAMPGAAVTQ